MPTFYMNYRDEHGATLDEEGYDCPLLEHMQAEAICAARESMAEGVMRGIAPRADCSFEVTDETGAILHTLMFLDALDGSMPAKWTALSQRAGWC